MAKEPAGSEPGSQNPEATAHLSGQQSAEGAFLRAFNSGRMPHAWLIAGPRGIGKATLAFRIARFLLSRGARPEETTAEQGFSLFGNATPVAGNRHVVPDTLEMAASHPVFRRVRELSHSDLRVLRRETNEKTGRLRTEIIVDQVRDAIEFLHLTPGESDWRVLVIDPVDDLNRNAANALLKMLEEPRPRTCILLVSHAAGRLLPTVRSRCRKLALEPLAPGIIGTELARHGINLGMEELALCTALSDGSLGRALEFGGDTNGRDTFEAIIQLLATWPRYDVTLLHRLGDRLAGKVGEENFTLAAGLLDWWLTRFIRWAAARDRPFVEVFPGEIKLMTRLRGSASLDHWLQSWEKVGRLFARVNSANLDRKQAWATAWLVLASTRA
jgi:DNA polymerase-3 subunit delta'